MSEQESILKKKFNGAWVYLTLQIIAFIPLQFLLVAIGALSDQPSSSANLAAPFFLLSILTSVVTLVLWFIKPKLAYWCHVSMLIMLIAASAFGELLGATPILFVILAITLILEKKILAVNTESTTDTIS
jgi:hypothetical protein